MRVVGDENTIQIWITIRTGLGVSGTRAVAYYYYYHYLVSSYRQQLSMYY